jgi:hypothetical protein
MQAGWSRLLNAFRFATRCLAEGATRQLVRRFNRPHPSGTIRFNAFDQHGKRPEDRWRHCDPRPFGLCLCAALDHVGARFTRHYEGDETRRKEPNVTR